VGPRAGVDRYGKSRPPPGFYHWTVQPVASRYNDYAKHVVGGHILTNSIFIVFYFLVAGINIVNYFSALNMDIPNITTWTLRS
jgi:hypothetical protein